MASFQPKPPPQAPGSRPGPVTRGRGDAVPWCPSSMAWPSPLGFFQLRNSLAFTLRCEPDVGHLTLQGRGHSRRPLIPYPQPLSAWGGEFVRSSSCWPSPLSSLLLPSPPPPHPVPHWHPCIFPPHQQEMILDRSQTSICPGQAL